MTDDKNISNQPEKDNPKEHLMDYLNDALNNQEQHAFEKDMMDDPFLNDAVEGLQQYKEKGRLQQVVQDLNLQLNQQIKKRKKQREKRRYTTQPFILIALVVLLLLVILLMMVVTKLQP
jgi:type II secretory pathway component PulF